MKALAITASLFVGLVAALVGWAAMTDAPVGGEPLAILAIEFGANSGATPLPPWLRSETQAQDERQARPDKSAVAAAAPRPAINQPAAVSAVAAPSSAPSTEQPTGLPPGISIAGIDPTLLGINAPGAPEPPAPMPTTTTAAASAAVPSTAASSAPVGPLPPAPVEGLVQELRYGPLPRIADDGRRPSEVYARPTRFASLPRLGEPARIAVVVKGLGLSEFVTSDGIAKLPPEVSLAFSAYGRDLQNWTKRAREAGHEIMLQVPMEPFDYPDNDPGPHTLLTSLPADENLKRLQWLMARFTGYVGITNHMGAKFAAAQESFLPVLEEFKSRGLIYVDDGTSARSTASQIARQMGVRLSVAQVSIDAVQSAADIDQALAKLEKVALENGVAIGVGTSLPVTIERLAKWTATLKAKGIVLIPVSAAVRGQSQT